MQLFKVFYCKNCDEVTLEPEYIDSITCPKCDKKMTHRGNVVLDTDRIKKIVIEMGLTDFRLVAVPEEFVKMVRSDEQ